jgi:hypothetical protein
MHSHLAIRHLIRHVAERRQNGMGQPILPPSLTNFIDEVCQLYEPFQGVARAGYECLYGDDRWEIAVFLGETEAIGGPLDGELHPVSFRFDVRALTALFDEVHSLSWNAIPTASQWEPNGQFETFLTIEGIARDQRISLQVHALPPDSAGPGMRRHVDGRLELV